MENYLAMLSLDGNDNGILLHKEVTHPDILLIGKIDRDDEILTLEISCDEERHSRFRVTNVKKESNKIKSEDYIEVPNILELSRPEKWTYTMRRHMQEVAPGVFLGPYSAASRSNLQSLLDHGITHIICIRQAIEANFIRPNFPHRFKYLVLDIADTMTENIIQHFKKVKVFIDESLSLNGRVLVHGNAGISRSAALVLAYIMETYELSQGQAYMLVQQRRFCISPNEGFIIQLKEYEPIYKAEKMLKNSQQNLESQCSKRTIHQIDLDNQQDKIEDVTNS